MLITKVLETSVDLFDSADIFAVDVKKLLIDKLTARYANKCYMSMLITGIVEIIRHSDRRMVDNRLDGGSTIDVQFKAQGIILVRGEILHGCKVVDISSSKILVDHKYASGMLIPDPKKQVIKIIKKDQLIPVRVNDVRYNVGQSQISVRGMPYSPTVPTNTFYSITKGLSPDQLENIKLLIKEYHTELAKHESLSKSKPYEFFREVIYPYKNQQKFELSKQGAGFTAMDIDDAKLLTYTSGCIVSPSQALKSNEFIYYSNNANSAQISADLYMILADCINRRIIHLMGLRGFAEQYDTPEKTQELVAYWRVCQSLKE